MINIYLFNVLYAFSWNKKEVARMYGVENSQNSLHMYTHWDPRSSQQMLQYTSV